VEKEVWTRDSLEFIREFVEKDIIQIDYEEDSESIQFFFNLILKNKKEEIFVIAAYLMVSCLINSYPLRAYYDR